MCDMHAGTLRSGNSAAYSSMASLASVIAARCALCFHTNDGNKQFLQQGVVMHISGNRSHSSHSLVTVVMSMPHCCRACCPCSPLLASYCMVMCTALRGACRMHEVGLWDFHRLPTLGALLFHLACCCLEVTAGQDTTPSLLA